MSLLSAAATPGQPFDLENTTESNLSLLDGHVLRLCICSCASRPSVLLSIAIAATKHRRGLDYE